MRLLHEPIAVAGFADGGGRHRDHALRSRAVGDRLEIPERLEGPVDRLRTEPVVVAQLSPEAERRTRVFEHVQMLSRAQTEDDHPCRVRTDIHDGERPVVVSSPPTHFHGSMLPHGTRSRLETLGGPESAGPSYAPRAMTTLFLIRHGLTAVTGSRLYGRTPGIHLDERGRRQAAALVERFEGVRLTALYSSPLERCIETMEPLAEARRLEIAHLGGADRDGRRRLDGTDAPLPPAH